MELTLLTTSASFAAQLQCGSAGAPLISVILAIVSQEEMSMPCAKVQANAILERRFRIILPTVKSTR
jgi:hypothetical protein